MKDIVIFGDLHLGDKNKIVDDKTFVNEQLTYLEKELFPYLLKNKIKKVISLGDIFHNREFTSNYILQEVEQRLFNWFEDNNIHFYVVVGNHDMYYKKNKSHSVLYIFEKNRKYIHIAKKPTVIGFEDKKIGLVPFDTEPENFPECDVLCGHFDIIDFKMNNSSVSKKGFDKNLFAKFLLVLSGHYHTWSQQENIHYCGSLFPLTRNDFGNFKRFYRLNSKLKLTKIENTWSPRHIDVYYKEIDGEVEIEVDGLKNNKFSVSYEDSIKTIGNNFVKLIIEKYDNYILLEEFRNNVERILETKNEKLLYDEVAEDEKQIKYSNNIDGIKQFFEKTSFPKNINVLNIKNKTLELHSRAKSNQL